MNKEQYQALKTVWFSIAHFAYEAFKDKQGNLKAIDTAIESANEITRAIAQQLGIKPEKITHVMMVFQDNHLNYGEDLLNYPIILHKQFNTGKTLHIKRVFRKAYPLPN